MSSDLSIMLCLYPKEIAELVDQAMLTEVVPALRRAVDAGARQMVVKAGAVQENPFVQYVAAELLIKKLADMLTLTDTDEITLMTPHMLAADQYTTYWIEELS